jgi:hypothetical protein
LRTGSIRLRTFRPSILNEWKDVDKRDKDWWANESETDFAQFKKRLPGPLAIHREPSNDADRTIIEGRKEPVLKVGGVACVWTPPKKWARGFGRALRSP